jgi:predicted KAP-like P-loop ATPase
MLWTIGDNIPMSEEASRTSYDFSADRPIRNRSQDQLGRQTFAEELARAVREWRGSDSLVIALYGPWGSGKTSVKNMVVDSLREDADGKGPQIVEFNPWQFANRDQLAEAFFRELGAALGQQGKASWRDRKKLVNRWRAYAAYLQAGTSLFDVLRGPVFWILLIIAAFVAGTYVTAFRRGAVLLAGALVLLAMLLRGSSKFAETVAKAVEAGAAAGHKTLEEMKEEIAESLRALPVPLLVVMDDVDRLTAQEAHELFQLVKANADFPKLVYLLLFQREVVERNLAKLSRVPGKEFLEKIVQVGFDIPIVERPRLQKVLTSGLDRLLGMETIGRRFDQRRWGNLFVGGLQHYFDSLRGVYRFLSTLSFHIGVFRGASSFEVNPVDLIALEVLRVFEPAVYRALARNKDLLTRRSERGLESERTRKAAEQAIISIVDVAPPERREHVREIIKQLFPPAEWALAAR